MHAPPGFHPPEQLGHGESSSVHLQAWISLTRPRVAVMGVCPLIMREEGKGHARWHGAHAWCKRNPLFPHDEGRGDCAGLARTCTTQCNGVDVSRPVHCCATWHKSAQDLHRSLYTVAQRCATVCKSTPRSPRAKIYPPLRVHARAGGLRPPARACMQIGRAHV